MSLAWQQGRWRQVVGAVLVADPLPSGCCSPSRFAGDARAVRRQWVVESEDVVLLHEPDRYPVAFFPWTTSARTCSAETRTTETSRSRATAWFKRFASATSNAQRAACSTRTCRATRPCCRTGSPSPGDR